MYHQHRLPCLCNPFPPAVGVGNLRDPDRTLARSIPPAAAKEAAPLSVAGDSVRAGARSDS